MRLRVQALRLGIVVMRNSADIDPAATNTIRTRRFVELPAVQDCLTFRPILQTQIVARGSPADLIVVVRFRYLKDRSVIRTTFQPQVFEQETQETMFYPDIVLNLAAYRGRQMLGLWEVAADIAATRQRDLNMIARGHHVEFLGRLRYQELASFQWEVIAPLDQRLTPTGELRRPQARSERLHEAAVSVEDI